MPPSPQILSPTDAYNFSAKPIVVWRCVPGFTQSRVVLRDSNDLLMQDTGWRSINADPSNNCQMAFAGSSIGHDIPAPWPGEPGGRWVKGLTLGRYNLKLDLKDSRGQVLTATKDFDIIPNLDLTFRAGAAGKWTAIRGDWGSITPSTFGAHGRTAGFRDTAFHRSPVYADGPPTADFQGFHVYSYTISMKVNCADSSCAAGPAFGIIFTGSDGARGDLYQHLDFLVSGAGQLSVEGYADSIPKRTFGTIDLNRFSVDVHQFFSLRIEFRGSLGATAIFVNDQKIYVKNVGNWVLNGGKVGFAYESSTPANSFEVQSLFVRPSIWEGIGVFEKYPIE